MKPKKSKSSSKAKKILLVAMPWALHTRPSLPIAALKSYLNQSNVKSEAAHWFVEIAKTIGFQRYQKISQTFCSCEVFYSYLLFPELRQTLLENDHLKNEAQRFAQIQENDQSGELIVEWTADFFEKFEQLHQDILNRYRWEDYLLVGFTLNYEQNLASLYMAQEIKKRNPQLKIIFGGATASRELGESLVEHFPFVDYACNGEGEKPLLNLAKGLQENLTDDELQQIKGLTGIDRYGHIYRNAPDQILSMNELPKPDFSDYFSTIAAWPEGIELDANTLLLESSRGCYYHCSFCALNLQWENFRSQEPEIVAKMMRELAEEYGILNFFFVDNITPKNTEAIFNKVLEDGMDYRFFYEIRATLPRKTLEILKEAGLVNVQIGVEALSTSLLKKFDKKSHTIHNFQAMKSCEELGLLHGSNLITDYPFSTQEEVEETLRNIDFISHLRPLNAECGFVLSVGAPDYDDRENRGITVLGNAPQYENLYPPRLFDTMNLIYKKFRFDGESADWSAVKERCREWRIRYEENKKILGGNEPQLAYRDGKTFMKVEDFRKGYLEIYYFNEWERNVYLFADQIASAPEIFEEFKTIPKKKLQDFLNFCIENRLMFREDQCYLSLAISTNLKLRARCKDRSLKITSVVQAETETHVSTASHPFVV